MTFRIPCALALLLAGALPASSQNLPADRVDRLLERLAGYGYAGAFAVAEDGEVVHAAGYGRADVERGTPVESDTRFDIGSLTKPFVATVVLRLAEQGRLSVEDTIGALLNSVPPDKAGITLHQLLTHTSGLVRSAAMLDVDAETPRDRFITAVMESDLLYPPGERFEYSDTGYDLLAALAEISTGQPFDALLRRLILEPAGLDRTGYATAEGLGAVAPAYTGALGTPWIDSRSGPSHPTWFNRGSGALISTVADLVRFEASLRAGKILEPESVDRMTTGHVPAGTDRAYGYGWFVLETRRGRVVYHGGDIAGYKAYLARYVDDSLVFAGLSNVYGWERTTDRDAVAAWFGEGPEPPPAAAPGEVGKVEGTYRTSDGEPLVIWIEAGQVMVEVARQAAVDQVFGVSGEDPALRTADARRVVKALEAGDLEFLESRLRDRNRIAGLANRLIGYWALLAERGGAVRDFQVLGSYPAQDGTIVSLVEIERDSGTERFRLIWRGDRLVTAGGGEGLRRPTAAFEQTGPGEAARFIVADGTTTRLTFERDAVRVITEGRESLAWRDRETPIDPPALSTVRALLPVFARDGAAAGLARYHELREANPGRYDFGEEALNDLGYRLLNAGLLEEAIGVFRRNVAEYPDSWNVHDSLGEAYLAAGRTAAARASYARSLELNPDNETAREVLGAVPQEP